MKSHNKIFISNNKNHINRCSTFYSLIMVAKLSEIVESQELKYNII